MSRYIDADKAESLISNLMPSLSTPDGAGEYDEKIFAAQEMCGDCMEAIHNISNADITEFKHGKWITSTASYETPKCSVCNWHIPYTINIKQEIYKYCPNCGTKMEHRIRSNIK